MDTQELKKFLAGFGIAGLLFVGPVFKIQFHRRDEVLGIPQAGLG